MVAEGTTLYPLTGLRGTQGSFTSRIARIYGHMRGNPTPTFSIGALIVAEKLDSTKVLSSISRPPVVFFAIGECLIAQYPDGTSAYAMPVRFPSATSNVLRFDPSRLAL